MPVLTRVLAALAVLLALGCAGIGWWAASTRAENARLVLAVAGLQSDLAASKKLRMQDQEVATRHAASVVKLTTTQKAQDEALRAALAAESLWGDSPVPAGVAAALGMPSPTPSR